MQLWKKINYTDFDKNIQIPLHSFGFILVYATTCLKVYRCANITD